ncbi:MAG: BlaI/MecI/CopY family transcriptional regulator [Wenzhouxiangellaceae bacterium]
MPRLGELESTLLEHLWSAGSATARSAHEAIGRSRGISLNTVQSTLDRLHRKGLLERRKISRAFHYSASVTRASLLAALVAEAAVRFGEDRSTAMSALVDAAEQLDEAALSELERLIEARRAGREDSDD